MLDESYGIDFEWWFFGGDEPYSNDERYAIGEPYMPEFVSVLADVYIIAESNAFAEHYDFEEIFVFGGHYERFFEEFYGINFEAGIINLTAEIYGNTFEEHYGILLCEQCMLMWRWTPS